MPPESGLQADRERHEGLTSIWEAGPGWRRLTVVNHTVVGKRFIFTSLAFFLIGGVLAMLIRAQLAMPDNAFLGHGAYNQVFTMHGTVMMFLFTIPMLEGIAMYLLPKMLGARDLAFPRLSAFGYWCFLFGGLILIGAMVAGLAPDSGWFMYTPLSGAQYTPGINADVWLIGVTFVEVAAICAGVELVATVLTVRADGMSLRRMPLLAWYVLVAGGMILVGFPPLVLASVLLEVERAFGWPFFDVTAGGDPLLWQHLFWMFGHPEVYIIFLPAAGIVSTLIPVFARRPIVGYTWIVASIVATGFISFGLWVHHMFTVGIPHLAQAFFSAASMLVAVPTAVQFFAWIATLWSGRPVVNLPMLYLFGFLVIFVLGGLTGVMLALVPFNWQAHDTHFVVAHLHYVLVGGLVFPLLAGAYYWLPHFSGRTPSARLGHWAFWLIFIGFNLTFLGMHLTGLAGMPRRVYTYTEGLGWEWLNLVSSLGGFVMSAGFALLLLDLLLHARYGEPAPRNPWKAPTLEWATATPPPVYNFASLPAVSSREPLWDTPELAAEMARGEHYSAAPRHDWQETLGVDPTTGRPEQLILLPRPSLLPLGTALAVGLFFLAFLLRLYPLSLVGAVLALLLALRWAWDSGFTRDPEPQAVGQGLSLPLHVTATRPPGWWGLSLSLLANGTFFAALLFGYLYLWTVSPGWPPPALIGTPGTAATLAALALVAGAACAHRTVIANAADAQAPRAAWLGAAAVAGALSTVAFSVILRTDIAPADSHAYAAVSTMIAGYAGLHALLGTVLAAYAWLRCRAGYVGAQRPLDLRLLRIWWVYTAAVGVLALLALYGLPAVMGS